MTSPGSPLVNQCVIAWSPHSMLGTRGVGPVVASLVREDLAAWWEHLHPYVWAAEEPPGSPSGLTYVRFGETAVVLHKVPVADAQGRPGSTLTHALTGPAGVLTAERALQLARWDGWYDIRSPLPPDGTLDPLVLPSPGPAMDHDKDVARTSREAAQVLAALLASPTERFTVVGAAADPTQVLQVVLDIAAAVGGLGETLTFSTRESSETGMGRTQVGFLVHGASYSAYGGQRLRITLDGGEESGTSGGAAEFDVEAGPGLRSPYWQLADALVEAYREDGPSAMAEIRSPCALLDRADVDRWAVTAQLTDGVLNTPLALMRRAVLGTLSTPERTFLDGDVGRGMAESTIARVPDSFLCSLPLAHRAPDTSGRIGWIYQGLRTEALSRYLRGQASAELWDLVARLNPTREETSAGLAPMLQMSIPSSGDVPPGDARLLAVARALVLDPRLPLVGETLTDVLAETVPGHLFVLAHEVPDLALELVVMALAIPRGSAPPVHVVNARARAAAYEHGFFLEELRAHVGSGPELTEAIADVLFLVFGEEISSSPILAERILARHRGGDAELLAIALLRGSPDEPVLHCVQRHLALPVVRRYIPTYAWHVSAPERGGGPEPGGAAAQDEEPFPAASRPRHEAPQSRGHAAWWSGPRASDLVLIGLFLVVLGAFVIVVETLNR